MYYDEIRLWPRNIDTISKHIVNITNQNNYINLLPNHNHCNYSNCKHFIQSLALTKTLTGKCVETVPLTLKGHMLS